MEKSFWVKNWEINNIGFHNSDYNELLLKHFDKFDLKKNSNIFVPLCGKSLDLIWLATKSHRVTGVEVSPLAVQGFFDENKLEFEKSIDGNFNRYSCSNPPVDILEGDFFDANKKVLGNVDFVYDRASIVALPSELRRKYTEHMTELLSPGAQILLVSMEYEHPELIGPPFSVTEREINSHYQDNFKIELLEDLEKEVEHPRFQEAGVKSWSRKVYKLTRN